jgi:hypothetical protein
MISNREHTHHNRFSLWNCTCLSVEYTSGLLLLTLTLLNIQIVILALRLLLLRHGSSRIIGIVLPWIRAVLRKVAWLSTIVAGKVMGYWSLVSNTRGIWLLCKLWGCGRTEKCLRLSLVLWWTISWTKMVLRVVNKLLALLNAARRARQHLLFFSSTLYVGGTSLLTQ